MTGTKAFHALGLHMHQPPGNLKLPIESNPREAANVELVGMGYYHPIFPLVPTTDREEQLASGRAIMEHAFGRAPRGFWPPEMAFAMEMIPARVKAGYESSCFLFRGDAWIPHLYARADAAERDLAHAERDPGLAGDGS